MITLDPRTTALVLIDLQNGILGRKLAPVSADELVARGKALAEKFRAARAPVVLVNAAPNLAGPERQVDEASASPRVLPDGFADLAPGLAEPGDILITKPTWGAFFRTDLDSGLKTRGVRTIVLGGVATHIGVDTTARQAWDLGYELVIARDVITSMGVEPHEATLRHVLPRISRVADSNNLAFGG
ncbi:MAG: isochorismatase family protein [Roseiarcus sp.]